MISGIYSVSFRAQSGGSGNGVIVFTDSKIYGGDSAYFYKGQASIQDNTIACELGVARHATGDSVFGPLQNFELQLTGSRSDDTFVLDGIVKGHPNFKIRIDGHKIGEL